MGVWWVWWGWLVWWGVLGGVGVGVGGGCVNDVRVSGDTHVCIHRASAPAPSAGLTSRQKPNACSLRKQVPSVPKGGIHFHPKSISSTDTFIHFHPITFSTNDGFIQKKSHVVQSTPVFL